jgi:hypothetical protein
MKATFLTILLYSAVLAAAPNSYYVAVDGNDDHAGTLEAPFATLNHVHSVVRQQIAAGLEEDITVYLRGGTYYLDAPLVFTPEDGGADGRNITYTAYESETPVLSGGRQITGWHQTGDGKWTTTVSEVVSGHWHFRQLFRNEQRLPRGRFPKGDGFLRVTSLDDTVTEITLNEPLPEVNFASNDVELVVLQHWSITRMPVVSGTDTMVRVSHPAGWIGHETWTITTPGKACHIENGLALVTVPGEWYLDRSTGVLTYFAYPDEDPNTAAFTAPFLERLLVVRGEDAKPVQNLAFSGITFAHSEWPLPEFGYVGIQAGHHGTSMDKPIHVLPGAVEFTFAVGCRMERCSVRHAGASGIVLGAGCRNNIVTQCEIKDVGGNGIMVGWRGADLPGRKELVGAFSLSADWTETRFIPQNNTVSHCTLLRCGAVNYGCVGIFDAFSDGTRIAHNLITDLPYTGIAIGFRWDESETSHRNCVVEYNHIHDVMKLLADGGAIYTLGYQPGTALRNNLLHGVHRSEFAYGAPNNGIFFDKGSKGYTVEGNIIYDTSGEPIRFNLTGPENLTLKDNSVGVPPGTREFPQEAAEKIRKSHSEP